MQMEIRFASWTRVQANFASLSFDDRTNRISTIEGDGPVIRIIQLQKCLARERDIYIYIPEAQKNLLKKGKKNVSIFPWRTKELFLPEHQYRILSKPLFLSLSKTFTSRRGGDKKERVPHDGEARNLG